MKIITLTNDTLKRQLEQGNEQQLQTVRDVIKTCEQR